MNLAQGPSRVRGRLLELRRPGPFRRKKPQPPPPRSDPDLGPGDEHRHRGQPAGEPVHLTEVPDPIQCADEDLLQQVRDVFVRAQYRAQRQAHVFGVSIVEGRRRARMPGPQRFDQRGIVSNERQGGEQGEPILDAIEAHGIRRLLIHRREIAQIEGTKMAQRGRNAARQRALAGTVAGTCEPFLEVACTARRFDRDGPPNPRLPCTEQELPACPRFDACLLTVSLAAVLGACAGSDPGSGSGSGGSSNAGTGGGVGGSAGSGSGAGTGGHGGRRAEHAGTTGGSTAGSGVIITSGGGNGWRGGAPVACRLAAAASRARPAAARPAARVATGGAGGSGRGNERPSGHDGRGGRRRRAGTTGAAGSRRGAAARRARPAPARAEHRRSRRRPGRSRTRRSRRRRRTCRSRSGSRA